MSKVLITGASRGIGLAIKNKFAAAGFEVLAPSRKEMDLSNDISIDQYLSSVSNIDVLINCAGINDLASLSDVTDEKLQNMIQVNLLAQMRIIKHVSKGMIKNRYGRIVNFSSIWSKFSKEKRVMYSVAKSGVNGLTTASAVEFAKYNVLVNAVAPGFVKTEMTSQNNTEEQLKVIADALPIKRLAAPSEIAELVFFLASDKNSFMTGQTLFVDGGFSCV